MPLIDSLADMKLAASSISLFMNAPGNETAHLGQQWCVIAQEFFANGVNPKWTPAGLEAGKTAFAQAFGATLPPDPTGQVFAAAVLGGFFAFAGVAGVPANAVPGVPPEAPPLQVPPVVPPPAPPAPITIPPPSNSTDPLAIEIYNKSIAWTPAGLVSVVVAGAPVPTTPWS